MSKIKVLFLCTGNSARSQMAEALLRHLAGNTFEVFSAGLDPKGINPLTTRVMEEIGIPLEGHYAKHVNEYMGKIHFGYLITVCSDAEQRCPSTFPGISHRLHWAFDDPGAFVGTAEENIKKFREIRDQIDLRIRLWLEERKSEGAI
ncbi:arsenate reductase ArsC [Syntrophus aciditrophicus]|mgnify:CR=1|uniref:Phosphotyrosine protein phosphatase n=1 Tax=Syntrophus aciditrophicus (strain SB) TaxID=56780 RepID=Q2LTF6_SYNAS|nr:arsenate reductase ArsC [Syntrophus aciditrophicus]ABC77365.1 phosphotyrosine protein phosphatase [Syntrophus aciditrophicus SB]